MALTRRRFIALVLSSLGGVFAWGCGSDGPSSPPEGAAGPGGEATAAAGALLQPTPACGDDEEPTPSQTEGPYFTPNSPERASLLEAGISGERLLVEGYVLSTDCRRLAGALLDFWQADAAGQYDNVGYGLRGHQFTDASGRYRLETVLPGLYPGRTRHIHVKAQAKGGRVLTTQLYFPSDAARNAQDGIFDARLLLQDFGDDDAGGKRGHFDFVLSV